MARQLAKIYGDDKVVGITVYLNRSLDGKAGWGCARVPATLYGVSASLGTSVTAMSHRMCGPERRSKRRSLPARLPFMTTFRSASHPAALST